METDSLELSDRDQDALTLYLDGAGIWVTCTSDTTEVSIGPLDKQAVLDWLSTAQPS